MVVSLSTIQSRYKLKSFSWDLSFQAGGTPTKKSWYAAFYKLTMPMRLIITKMTVKVRKVDNKRGKKAWTRGAIEWSNKSPRRSLQAPLWWTQNCLWVFEGLLWRCGSTMARHGDRATGSSSRGRWRHMLVWVLSEVAKSLTIQPSDSRTGWPQTIQLTGREHSPTYQHRVRLKFDWSWPCPLEQDPIFPTASLSYQEACTSLFSSSIRG